MATPVSSGWPSDAPGGSPDAPTPAEVARWQQRLNKARDSEYSDLKAAVTSWATAVTTVVGVASSVSIFLAPKALSSFSHPTLKWMVLVVGLVGAVLAAAAVVAAVRLANQQPRDFASMDALMYRQRILDWSVRTPAQLQRAKRLAYCAAAVLALAGGLSLLDSAIPATVSPPNVLVVHRDGRVSCGALSTTTTDVVSATVVSSC